MECKHEYKQTECIHCGRDKHCGCDCHYHGGGWCGMCTHGDYSGGQALINKADKDDRNAKAKRR